jgi:hypothetical protein
MSMTLEERLALPLPKRLRTRPRDKRGYPIPFIVLVDRSHEPQFTINDVRQTGACITKKLCSLCGKRFEDGMWFVGGSRCFMHEHGAFIDPPMHHECAEYALQVCPFLAAPSYAKRIDDRKLKAENMPKGMLLARVDHMPPDQPERFGLGCTQAYRLVNPNPGETIFVADRWDYVEWWRNGVTINAPDAAPTDQPWVRFG